MGILVMHGHLTALSIIATLAFMNPATAQNLSPVKSNLKALKSLHTSKDGNENVINPDRNPSEIILPARPRTRSAKPSLSFPAGSASSVAMSVCKWSFRRDRGRCEHLDPQIH